MNVNRNFYALAKDDGKGRIFFHVYKKGLEHRIFRCNFNSEYYNDNFEKIMTDIVTCIIDKYNHLDKALAAKSFIKTRTGYYHFLKHKRTNYSSLCCHTDLYLSSNKRKKTGIKKHFDKISYQINFCLEALNENSEQPSHYETICNYQGFLSFDEVINLNSDFFLEQAVSVAVKKFGL